MEVLTRLSKAEKVLLALSTLMAECKSVSVESLLVWAWTEDKEAFGLAGYSDLYPDSNKVICYLMGRKGLIALGYVERVSPKVYRLTERGRIKAEALSLED